MTLSRPVLASLAALVALAPAAHADALKVSELRTQKVGPYTYFTVRFEQPADYRAPELTERSLWWQSNRPELARLPRLVPQDDNTKAVYLRLRFPDLQNAEKVPAGQLFGNPAVDGLTFAGRVEGKGPAKFLLLYPTGENAKAEKKDAKEKESELVKLLRQRGSWGEAEVTLDFGKGKQVAAPGRNRNGNAKPWPAADDLEGQWAAAQAAHFAVQDALSPDSGFYAFAREATGRKYSVPSPRIQNTGWNTTGWPDREFANRRLYEMTTGAAAIAETMAINRMRNGDFRDKGERTVDIAKVPGIEIAEHPWEKMMAGKKPSPEPLARLIPGDNYYLHFKSIVKFLDAGDLMDQWGTTVTRAFEVNSRDYQLKERIEEQICLRSTGLARVFGPAVIKGIAITGSDPYIREGSDVAVIFHLNNKQAFFASVNQFINEARKKHGKDLSEGKEAHLGVSIESYTTPQREVSLHRATLGDFVVYGNSVVGVKRIIEVHAGKRKALWDMLDFQYMRTVFRLEDQQEDGFLFLSDAFLRNLVGPATRIKERRRLEGLTSLYMVTQGAMFTAWETGKLPDHHNALLAHTGLKAAELFSPEGQGAFWEAGRQTAVSDTYNTIRFATPLIELPIDKITPQEQQEYQVFRDQYLGLWRRFFDPIGARIAVSDKQARVELYILPLVKTTQYDELRRFAGGGTIKLDPAQKFSPKTLGQFLIHISPEANERKELGRVLSGFSREIPGLNWLGDWVTVRIDDSDAYGKLAELLVRRELQGNRGGGNFLEESKLIFQMPISVGVDVKNKLVFAGVLAAARQTLQDVLPGSVEWEPRKPAYKGVTIVRVKAGGDLVRELTGEEKGQERFEPALFYATLDDGWYVSLREEPIKDLIDRWDARKKGKAVGKAETVEVNSSLYVAPAAAEKAKGFLRFYLEWEAHQRAMVNEPLLEALYRCGLVTPGAADDKVARAALRFYGFVPVSPDGSAYRYDPKAREVMNARHGSLRRPQLHPGVEADSPLGRLLEEFRSIRADLRFREDGVNTTITFDRRPKGK